MKEQFLDDIGLEELIGYIKKYVKDDQDVKPYASYSVFPKTGEQNIIYIDTTNNLTYYWDDTSKTYKALDVQTWDNLSGKPSTFPPSTHNHDDRYYTETEINTKLAGKANSSHTHKKADITDFPTSMPASDVKAWAKADTKPSYSKSEVGLGNVDNTADKDKSVKYATSAGAASSVDWSGVKNKPGTYPPSAHNHNIENLTNFNARVYDAAGTRAANTVLAAPSDSNGTARFRKLVAADLPSHTHNYAGSASAGGAANSSLSLYLNPSTRQTSGDYDLTSPTYAYKVTHSIASTIMKTGRPPEDSSVLTFGWDTYAGWGAQLAIGSQKGNHLYIRGANSKQKTVNNKTVNYSEWDSDWRTILDSGNYTSYAATKSHTHDDRYYTGTIITSATIGGQSVNYANSAGKLSTSRTISLTGSVTGSGNFDGSGNLTISTATSHTHNSVTDINSGATTTFAYSKAGMGYGDFTWLAAWNGNELRAVNKSLFATAGHTHSYLPLSGGTMGGTAFITWADSGNWSNSNKNVTFPVNRGGLQWNGQSDYVKLFSQETGHDNLELVLQFGDDNSNGLSIRNNVGNETARITASGGFTGTFYGNLSGKASTAGTADVANSVAWSNVSGKPGTFTPSSHTHTNIVSRGRKNPCASGTTGNNADAEVNVTGLSLTEAYNASTPTSFGNIINVIGANSGGAGQLFLGWSGADSVTEHLYYRSHRDTTTGGWGPWRTVAFTTDNVASANTLTSNAGSATQPIYFSGGKPVACSYSLSKSVPSNAVFTDTNTWRGCQNNLTSTATDQSLSAAQGKWLNENKLNAINANGYWGMATPSGNSGDWIRTTSAGIIPYQPGGINSSHCGLGTSSWYFNYAYITTVYGNLSGNASTASKLATARNIALGGLSSGSANFDGSGNVTINDWGYGVTKYVTRDSASAPYYRIAYCEVKGNWIDKSIIFTIDSGYNGGGFGIVKACLRSDNTTTANQTYCEVIWLVRQGFSADQLLIKVNSPAGTSTVQYADLYFKATGTYNGITVKSLSSTSQRDTVERAWTFTNPGSESCRAQPNIRTYTATYTGCDAGTASYANSAGNATQWNGRTLDIGTEAGSDAGWLLIDNGGIVRHRSASYFATAGHTHNYLPLSGGTMTGNINYTTHGNSYIGNGQQDNAEGPGGKLNNLVIGSWWGVSFTTSCSGQTYSGKTAVGIDCREGIIKAARVNANSFNGYTINASVPSGAKFTDTNTWRGIQDNLSSNSTSDSLSAAQGKRLKNLIDEKTDIHNLNYGIRFSSSSMDSNGSQNTLYPAKYENGAYSKTTGVSTYANRNNTIHIGTSSNMFGDICLAGGITSLGVYNVTTTTNLPVSVTSQGYIRRYKSGSSLMIKNHIYKIGYDEAKELLNTNVYSFRYNDDGQPANGKEHAAVNRYGFVLEDMEKTFPMAVEYDEYGLPAAWCVQIIVPTILEIVKHQQAEISSLKAENEELKEKISEIDNLKKSLDELRVLITNK